MYLLLMKSGIYTRIRSLAFFWLIKFVSLSTFPKPNLWWCYNGVIHFSILQPGLTITLETDCPDLELRYWKLQTFWSAMLKRKGLFMLQDNTRPHTSKSTWQKLMQFGINILLHSPYLPDLYPTNYHFFHALEAYICQQVYTNVDQVKKLSSCLSLAYDPSFYHVGINSLPNHWWHCINSNIAYFD